MQLLARDVCFEAVTADGTNTIVLIPQRELNIDDRVTDSANVLAYESWGPPVHVENKKLQEV